jgi:ribosomal protein S18 acetylase RimI-like enzyme
MPDAARAVVRRAGRDDADTVAALWLAARRAAVPAIPPPVHDDDDVRHWLSERLLTPGSETWVVEQDGALRGLLVLRDDWIDQLYVAPEHTGRGFGSKLVRFAQGRRTLLQLWTFQSNTSARRFYERHGFVARETTDGDNEEGAPDVRYVWHAPPPAK